MEGAPRIEKIERPAVMYQGQIYPGEDEMDALDVLRESQGDIEGAELRKVVDGFITTTGRFVDRQGAYMIAEKAGQLSHLDEEFRAQARTSGLYSEDLPLH